MKITDLATFIEHKKKEWFARDRKRGYDAEYITKYWNDEGIVWAVQEYYGSKGSFTEDDISTIDNLFGYYAHDIITLCEED